MSNPLRFLAILLLSAAIFGLSLTVARVANAAAEITGAGSTFVFPVLSRWADTYKKATGSSVNYQSIGSGGGIKMVESKTVDFGATDKPLSPEELAKQGLVQFPIVNGAVVPVIHLTGIQPGQLKLTGALLANIFLGQITKWNDGAITAINPSLKLPDQKITVVHRSDGSGTTFIWTNYLSKVSPGWKSKVGEETAVQWPAGVGAKGNEGVASNVQHIEGSIGYVEYAYAFQNKMTYTQIQNGAGQFIEPNATSFAAAVASADWASAKNYYLVLTNAPGAKSWPVAGSTFILMQKTQDKKDRATEVLKFFRWAFNNGQAEASSLQYVPIPVQISVMIEKSWQQNIKAADGAPVATGL